MTLNKKSLPYLIVPVVVVFVVLVLISAKVDLSGQQAAAIRIFKKDENGVLKIFGVSEQRGSNSGTTANGVSYYDPIDRNSILSDELKSGDDNVDVIYLQNSLRGQKLIEAEATGIFEEKTKQAVMEFQKSIGLETTGIANLETIQALNSRTLIEDDPSSQNPSARLVNGTLEFSWPEIRYPTGPIVYPPGGGPVPAPSIPSPICGNNVTFENMYIPFHGEVYRDRQQDFMNVKVNAPGNCPIAITGMDVDFDINYETDEVQHYAQDGDLRLNVDLFLQGVQFSSEDAIVTSRQALETLYGQDTNSIDSYVNYHPNIPGGESRTLTIGAKDPTLWFFDYNNEVFYFGSGWVHVPQWNELTNINNLGESTGATPIFRLTIKKIRYENTNTLLNGQHPQFEREVNFQGPILSLNNQTLHTYIHKDTWPFRPRTFIESLNSVLPPYGEFNQGNHFYWNSGEVDAGSNENPTTQMLANTQIQFCYPSDSDPWVPACSLIVSPVDYFTNIRVPEPSDGDLYDEGDKLYKTQMNISNLHPTETRTRTGKILIKKAFGSGTRHYYSPYNVTITSSEI